MNTEKSFDDQIVIVRLSTSMGQVTRGWNKYELFAPEGYTFSGGEHSLLADSMAEARRIIAGERLIEEEA